MPDWIIYAIILLVAVTVISKQPKIEVPTPSSLEDFSFPTAEEGRVITVVFGTRLISGANVVWYGDLKSKKIIKRVRSGFRKKKQTVGYKYYMGIHFVLCIGEIDRLVQVRVGKKELWANKATFDSDGNVIDSELDDLTAERAEAQQIVDDFVWEPGIDMRPYVEATELLESTDEPTESNVTGVGEGSITVYQENLFGGDKKEGGIAGTFSIYYGKKTQTTPPYLAASLPSDRVIPAYRGVTSVVLEQMYIGTQAYPKPWDFLICRTQTLSSGAENWYVEKSTINTYNLNPAHIIRECLTDKTWGIGIPEGSIDDVSFKAAADTLYAEGMGLSFIVNEEGKAEEFITDVLFQISAAMIQNRTTGLMELVLLRDDYVTTDLPHYGADEIRSVNNYTKPLVTELINAVVVTFWDRTLFETSTYRIHDPAAVAVQGGVVEQTVELKGVTDRELASTVATRLLIEGSTPVTSMEVTIDRTGIVHNVADVIRITWPQYGVVDTPFRILSIDEPEFGKGKITLKLVQDIFKFHEAIYAIPSDANWVEDSKPLPLEYYQAFEVPYGLALETYTEAELLDGSFDGISVVSTVGATGQSGASGYIPNSYDITNGSQDADLTDLSSIAKLTNELNPDDTAMTLTMVSNTVFGSVAEFEHIGFALIGGELIDITSWNSQTGVCGIKRGVYDTHPAYHSPDAVVYLLELSYFEVFDLPYPENTEVLIRFATQHTGGDLPLTEATARELTTQARIYRPYAPRAVKLDGVYFEDVIQPADPENPDVTVTWTPADRIGISNNPLDWFTDSGAAPAGMTYNIYFYNDDDDTLLESATGLSVTTYNATPAAQRIRMELEAEVDGIKSLPFKHVFLFPYFAPQAVQVSLGDLNMTVEGVSDARKTVSTDAAHFDPAFSSSALVGESATPQGKIASVPFAGYTWRQGTIWYQFRGQAGAATTLLPSKMVLYSDTGIPMLGFGINNGNMQIEIFDRTGENSTLFTSVTALTDEVYFTYKVDTYFKTVTFFANNEELDTVSWDSLSLTSMALTNTAIKELAIFDGIAGEFDHKVSQILCATDGDGIVGWRVKTVDITGGGTDTNWSGTYADISETVYDDTTMIATKDAGVDETVAVEDITNTAYSIAQVTVSAVATAPTGASVQSLVPIMERSATTTELGLAINVLNRSEYQPINYVMNTDPVTSLAWEYADLATTDFGVRSK